ncbi:MAG TPA: DUF4395 family protein [Candidatus Limnocylindrales bacterium]
MPVRARSADPYRDLDVIDARAPRLNQAIVGLGSLLTVVTGWWGFVALLALQLAVGLRFGRQYCLPCRLYFGLVQPRLGEGPVEDSRPPRFANQVGVTVLTASTLAYAVGLPLLGAGLATLVAALALLAATTGFCLGCEIYRLGAKVLGVRGGHLRRIDLSDVGITRPEPGLVVAFGHPLCSDCHALEAEVRASGRPLVSIDVRQERGLARKYGISVVPTAVTVAADGQVIGRLTG